MSIRFFLLLTLSLNSFKNVLGQIGLVYVDSVVLSFQYIKISNDFFSISSKISNQSSQKIFIAAPPFSGNLDSNTVFHINGDSVISLHIGWYDPTSSLIEKNSLRLVEICPFKSFNINVIIKAQNCPKVKGLYFAYLQAREYKYKMKRNLSTKYISTIIYKKKVKYLKVELY